MEKDVEKKKSGLGVAALVLGIIGFILSFIPIINNLAFVLGVIGIIFGLISLAKKSSKGQAIAGVILCILTIVITLSMQKTVSDGLNQVSSDIDKATGSSTEEVLANDVDVQLGKFEVTKGEYGTTDTKLTVKVTNKTEEQKSFSIHVEAVDANGSRIGEDYIYANNLGAGQSQNFDIFTFVSSDKVDALKNATFNIADASTY